jgi:hypothetical protein
METKITQGIFIKLFENYSNESTKLSKIFSIASGNELYKKFEVIQLCKTKQKDNTGREIYKIVVTVEYAYDALNLIEKYCNNGSSNRYNQGYPRGPKHDIYLHPERKEYEGVMDKKPHKDTLKIKNMDFYDIAVITNTHWITGAYNLFLRNSSTYRSEANPGADFQKYWFIPRPPNGSERTF